MSKVFNTVLYGFRQYGPEGVLALMVLAIMSLNLACGGLFKNGDFVESLGAVQQLMAHPVYQYMGHPFWQWPSLSDVLLTLVRVLPSGVGGSYGWIIGVSVTLFAISITGVCRWVFLLTAHRWAGLIAGLTFVLQWGLLRWAKADVSSLLLLALTVWILVWVTELSFMQQMSSYVKRKDRWRDSLPFLVGAFWFGVFLQAGWVVFISTGLLAAGLMLSRVRTAREAEHHLRTLGQSIRFSSLLMIWTVVLSSVLFIMASPNWSELWAELIRYFLRIGHQLTVLWDDVPDALTMGAMTLKALWQASMFTWAGVVKSFPMNLLALALIILWSRMKPYCKRLPDFFSNRFFVVPWVLGGVILHGVFPVAGLLLVPLCVGVFVSLMPKDLPMPLWAIRTWDALLLFVLMTSLALVLVLGYGDILPIPEHDELLWVPLSWLGWKGWLITWVVSTIMVSLAFFAWSPKARLRGMLVSCFGLMCWMVIGLYGVIFPVFARPLDTVFATEAHRALQRENTVLAIDADQSHLEHWFPRLYWAGLSVGHPVLLVRHSEDWSVFWADRLKKSNRRVIAAMRESTYYQLPVLMRHQSRVFSSDWGWKPSMMLGHRSSQQGVVPVNLFQYLQGARALDRWLLVVYSPRRELNN